MHTIKNSTVVLLAILLTASIPGRAQTSNRYLSIGSNSTSIDNLTILDSLDAENKIAFTAGFEIVPNTLSQTKFLLNELLTASTQKIKLAAIVLSTVNNNLELIEERNWKNVTVLEIYFPEMDATQRATAKIRIRIKAETATVTYDMKSKFTTSKSEPARVPLVSNYSLHAGGLPGNRVSKISAIHIDNNNNLPLTFNIELPVTEAKEWNDWFMTGPGGIKKELLSLELLGQDMRTSIMEINLGDVEITSYATGYSSKQQTLQRVTIGLRTQGISINTIK